MELRHFRYFVAVAEEMNFSRAAKKLNISQPPLSRQIKELEAELGFELFVRDYHKVELTSAGKTYLSRVKRILEDIESAKHDALDIASGRTGRLRIGYSSHLANSYLPRFLAEFQKNAQGIAIEVIESPSPKLMQALQEKTIDLAFPMMPVNTTGLAAQDFLQEPLVIALPRNHASASNKQVSLDMLREDDFILCRQYSESGFHEIVVQLCKQAGFTPRVQYTSEHKQTVLDMVAAGIGVSVVPQSARLLRSDGLCFHPFAGMAPLLKTVAVWREGEKAVSAESFVKIAKRELLKLKRNNDVLPVEQMQPVAK